MKEPELTKENTIGILFIDGVVKDELYGKIILNILRVPYEEVRGIDNRGDTRFLFKVTSYDRYKDICTKFSGKELEVERGYRIRVEDISSTNTRVCVSKVPFEISNDVIKYLFGMYGQVQSCEDYHKRYGVFKNLKDTGNRIVWIKLNQHIPQALVINQIQNNIHVTYPGQEQSCHKCGITGHLTRACKTLKNDYLNGVDIKFNSNKSKTSVGVSEISRNSSQNGIEYACSFCDYSSPNESKTDAHMASHTGERPFQCLICNARFNSKPDLKEHGKMHQGPPQHTIEKPRIIEIEKVSKRSIEYSCKKCDFTTVYKDILDAHKASHTREKPYKVLHTGAKPYKSPMSDVQLKSQPVLDKPKTTQRSDKPIACSVCSLQFSTSHEMAKHKPVHNKAEKILYCTKCNFNCTNEQMLERHFFSHSKRKPFKCTECDFLTPSENTLKNHRKNHFCKRFECTECDEKFSSVGQLSMHMKCHTAEKLIDVSFASMSQSTGWRKSPHNSNDTMKTKRSKRGMSKSPEDKPKCKKLVTKKL